MKIKSCVFCGKSAPEVKMSKEHVMRSALSKYLPAQNKEVNWHQKFRPDGVSEIASRRIKTPQSPFDMVVNDVCKVCNEGWLNINVEMPAEEYLARAMQGLRMPLTSNTCRAIALWAAKTAAVRALMDPLPRSIPPSHYLHMKDALEPPPNTFVWLASTEYCDKFFMRHTRLGTQDDYGRTLTTSHFTSIVYGFMAIYVVGASHAEGLKVFEPTVSKIGERDIRLIWPIQQSSISPMWPSSRLPLSVTRELTAFVPIDDSEFDPDMMAKFPSDDS